MIELEPINYSQNYSQLENENTIATDPLTQWCLDHDFAIRSNFQDNLLGMIHDAQINLRPKWIQVAGVIASNPGITLREIELPLDEGTKRPNQNTLAMVNNIYKQGKKVGIDLRAISQRAKIGSESRYTLVHGDGGIASPDDWESIARVHEPQSLQFLRYSAARPLKLDEVITYWKKGQPARMELKIFHIYNEQISWYRKHGMTLRNIQTPGGKYAFLDTPTHGEILTNYGDIADQMLAVMEHSPNILFSAQDLVESIYSPYITELQIRMEMENKELTRSEAEQYVYNYFASNLAFIYRAKHQTLKPLRTVNASSKLFYMFDEVLSATSKSARFINGLSLVSEGLTLQEIDDIVYTEAEKSPKYRSRITSLASQANHQLPPNQAIIPDRVSKESKFHLVTINPSDVESLILTMKQWNQIISKVQSILPENPRLIQGILDRYPNSSTRVALDALPPNEKNEILKTEIVIKKFARLMASAQVPEVDRRRRWKPADQLLEYVRSNYGSEELYSALWALAHPLLYDRQKNISLEELLRLLRFDYIFIKEILGLKNIPTIGFEIEEN